MVMMVLICETFHASSPLSPARTSWGQLYYKPILKTHTGKEASLRACD